MDLHWICFGEALVGDVRMIVAVTQANSVFSVQVSLVDVSPPADVDQTQFSQCQLIVVREFVEAGQTFDPVNVESKTTAPTVNKTHRI